MSCTLSIELLEKTIDFHGHSCPGLAIGIRVAEYALADFTSAKPEQLLCVTETDMCGVDGIQFLTGCTFGKGNLIHTDYGKVAFSFYNRETGDGVRYLYRGIEEKLGREEMREKIMQTPLPELFTRQVLEGDLPKAARVLNSLMCEECQEKTMESRTRRFDGKTLCIPCFSKVEQKV